MGSIVPPLSTNVALTLKTDYCGNMIYENGQLSKILTNVGYITLANSTISPQEVSYGIRLILQAVPNNHSSKVTVNIHVDRNYEIQK